jgi:hypothetical protein
VQHLRGGRAGQQQIRRFGVAERLRLVEHLRGIHRHLRRVAALHPEGDDLVADAAGPDPISVSGPIAVISPDTS